MPVRQIHQAAFRSVDSQKNLKSLRKVTIFRVSADVKVASAGILVKTGRKWQAQEPINRAETRLRHKTLVGTVARGWAGFGSIPKPNYDRAHGKEKCQLVLDVMRAETIEEA